MKASEVLGSEGIIASTLPGYESRPQQIRMAEAVESAIANSKHIIVEAGTGTGKSLAYLIPAILSGRRTVVSTAGKALQDQISKKDIPFLKSVLPDFTAAVLKGRSNYLCQHAWNRDLSDLATPEQKRQLDAISSWYADESDSGVEINCGDLESLPFSLLPEVAASVTSTSDSCLGKDCPMHGRCFAVRARTNAANANVIIVNHTLLTLDLALRQNSDDMASAIPDREVVVLDEVHSFESWAMSAFTQEISRVGISRLVNDRALQSFIFDEEVLTRVEDAADRFFAALEALQPDRNTASFAVSTPPERTLTSGRSLSSALRLLYSEVARATPRGEETTSESIKKRYLARVDSYAAMVVGIFNPSEEHVIYVEISIGKTGRKLVHLKRTPVSVSEDLRNALFNRWPTICTSATLAAGGSEDAPDFDYFKSCVGLDEETKFGELVEIAVGSPFDYQSQALIYLPPDGTIFDPRRYQRNSYEYFSVLEKEIEKLLLASGGRAFVLFTSNKAMEETYSRLSPRLRQWLVLKQGDYPRQELVRRFKEDGRAILFAVKSFWAGIDIAGEALSLVVIDKLPFQPPDDPVYAARCERLNRRYRDSWAWFRRLALPEAIISLKQGFGRLVRTGQDRGVVALLDGALTTKSYGNTILRALPPATITQSLASVQTFFKQ